MARREYPGAYPYPAARGRTDSCRLSIGRDGLYPALPPGRLGILMLGSSVLSIPGILGVAVGVTLQPGTTRAVRAIKMSTKLLVRGRSDAATIPTP